MALWVAVPVAGSSTVVTSDDARPRSRGRSGTGGSMAPRGLPRPPAHDPDRADPGRAAGPVRGPAGLRRPVDAGAAPGPPGPGRLGAAGRGRHRRRRADRTHAGWSAL